MGVFADILASWYAEHGRSLPWRSDPSPYHVWLSEIILQQTTIQQGTDYYLRFIKRWPTIELLATATEDEILREWQGLGYYTRARNLHAAAQRVKALGGFPSTYEEIRALPGVGPYTAAAIASIAYGLPHAVVDGNVYRVLSRYFADPTPVDTTPGSRHFYTLAKEILDPRIAGRHNEAMMDFGATQCTPHAPQCATCPLAASCQARAEGRQEQYPVKSRRTQVREVTMNYVLLHTPEGLLLRQRPKRGIWAGLWELVAEEDLRQQMDESILAAGQPLGTFRHQLTHRTIICCATAVELTSAHPQLSALHYQFVPWAELNAHALPKLIDNIIQTYLSRSAAKA